jgi:hypothetical protein
MLQNLRNDTSIYISHVVVEWLALLLHIREVPAILTEVFHGFPQSLQALKLGHERFLPHPSRFIIHCHPHYIVRDSERVVK